MYININDMLINKHGLRLYIIPMFLKDASIITKQSDFLLTTTTTKNKLAQIDQK